MVVHLGHIRAGTWKRQSAPSGAERREGCKASWPNIAKLGTFQNLITSGQSGQTAILRIKEFNSMDVRWPVPAGLGESSHGPI